jgi:hypothetical protein
LRVRAVVVVIVVVVDDAIIINFFSFIVSLWFCVYKPASYESASFFPFFCLSFCVDFLLNLSYLILFCLILAWLGLSCLVLSC